MYEEKDKCYFCGSSDIFITLRLNIDGETLEIKVCHNCAEKYNIHKKTAAKEIIDLVRYFYSGKKEGNEEISCPICGTSIKEVMDGKVGCENCYTYFYYGILELLENKGIYVTQSYCKVPKNKRKVMLINRYLDYLTKKEKRCVATEKFEEAAKVKLLIDTVLEEAKKEKQKILQD